MRLHEIVVWYQKKIGTYDKQQWEKTVEQKILNGFTGITLRNAKLKTEYIDVDLVRGSTFPKAKPKQSLLTVIRLAIVRCFLLPIYSKWWISQTSLRIFVILLWLYLTQIINMGIYCYYPSKSDNKHIISAFDLIIPMVLSLTLSLIHSQIVSTSSGSNTSSRKKQILNSGKQKETFKRRKKLFRVRSIDPEINPSSKILSGKLNLQDTKRNTRNQVQENVFKKLSNVSKTYSIENNCKKRTVNWDSPIQNYAIENIFQNCSDILIENTEEIAKTVETSVQEFYDNLVSQCINLKSNDLHTGDDDGFESLNGKSSSGEENNSKIKKRFIGLKVLENPKDIDENVDNCKSLPPEKGNLEPLKLIKPECDVQQQNQLYQRKVLCSSESDFEKQNSNSVMFCSINSTNKTDMKKKKLSKQSDKSSDTDEDCDDGDIISSPASISNANYTDCTTSATEWLGVTTNSDDCSYSSELENTDSQQFSDEDGNHEQDFTPTVILNPCGSSDRISCTIWDRREIKKAEMSVLDISSCIIEKVEVMPETCDYLYIGNTFTILLSLIPIFYRLCEATIDLDATEISYLEIPHLLWTKSSCSIPVIFHLAFGKTNWEKTFLIFGFFQRLFLTFLLFFLFTVAERTFKQRFLYAKLFSHLTSSRRAKKSSLPHFRLNKVRNIKTWLSVRSYLKKRGPQRSIDVIVSAAFIFTLLLLAFLSFEWLKDSVHLHSQLNMEALLWSSTTGIFLLRFMTLGNKINRKYRSISVLITEQINLYLQIEQKPKKKEELMVSNSVLKLAADLLKELESPFKISGLSANPYLYTTVKVVIMSALSGILSEMLGFKLKLHKIKIK